MAQQFEKVMPGDLITAKQMNYMLEKLKSLESRIAALEVTGPVQGAVVITGLIPSTGSVRVGEELQVLGQNFGFSVGAHQAFIDDFRVLTYKPGSHDQRLIFDIPLEITNVPTAGRQAILTVGNQSSIAQRAITLLPVQQTVQGDIDIVWENVDPATITPSNPATFQYRLISRANQAVTVTISPVISEVANPNDWQNQLLVLDNNQVEITSRTIQLEAGMQVVFHIRIPTVPNVPIDTTFNLTVNALSAAGSLTGSSGPRNFTVGQATSQQDSTINLVFAFSNPPDAVQLGTIRLTEGAGALITLNAEFTVIGTYDVIDPVVTGTNWSATRYAQETPSFYEITDADFVGSPQARTPSFIIMANPGASATGEVEFGIQRRRATLSRTISLGLERI